MKKALFLLLAMLAMGSPAFAQQISANLTTQASACASPPVSNATGYVFLPVNTANGVARISVDDGGSFSGTISFFVSGTAGSSWSAQSADASDGSGAVTSVTGTGSWTFNPGASDYICAAFTTASSGTAVVTIKLGQASARVGGSGGGGGGSPASPDQSVQINNMGAFGGSALTYEASGQAICTAVNADPCMYMIHTGEGTLMLSPDDVAIVNTDDDNYSSKLSDGALLITNMGDGSNCEFAYDNFHCTDGMSAQQLLGYGNGSLGLGANGVVAGSIILNGATSGSGTLGITDDSAYFTIPNSLVVGTTTLSPPTFPFTSVEPGEIFENDSAGNETVDLLNDGTLILGNAMGMEGGAITVLGLASMSGTRFVCVGTDGTLVSSATACVGT